MFDTAKKLGLEVWGWILWVFRIGKLAQKVESTSARYAKLETDVEALDERTDKRLDTMRLEYREQIEKLFHEIDARLDQRNREYDARMDKLAIEIRERDAELYKTLVVSGLLKDEK